MRPLLLPLAVVAVLGIRTRPAERVLTASPNANTAPAGTLRGGTLTIALEAKRSVWYPDGDSLPGIPMPAFAEEGKSALIPGPLIRVPAGTQVRLSVRNSLGSDTLTFHVPPDVKASPPSASDTLAIPPGEKREVTFWAAAPGNYIYRATHDTLSRRTRVGGLMTGAIVVDQPGAPRPRDRVLMLLVWADSANVAGIPIGRRLVFAVNGRSWPHTERLSATVGDTLRWRVINAGNEVHPMHLHGFYFRVDGLSGPLVQRDGQGQPGRMVVTERMSPFSAMSVTWVPERAGNWLFHCHFQVHIAPHAPLDSAAPRTTGAQRAAARRAAHDVHANHALTGMGGLVVGIVVKPRPGQRAEAPAPPQRHLRLVAVKDSSYPDSVPSLRFVLEEPARGRRTEAGHGFSPTLDLTRGEPVSITVVNSLAEPTAVHWHGIELDSYYDGVAGFGGVASRVSPIIAPKDSFEARFTPPRAGTFMYHSHVDEVRQQRAGLTGAIIVREAGAPATDDHTFFIKSARAGVDAAALLEINGQENPDTIIVAAGRPVRLRFISLALFNPNATVSLTSRRDSAFNIGRDTLIVQWRPVAKDGADLPPAARAPRLARQIIGMGETYDFEYVPQTPGPLLIEVRAGGAQGRLFNRVPMRVQ